MLPESSVSFEPQSASLYSTLFGGRLKGRPDLAHIATDSTEDEVEEDWSSRPQYSSFGHAAEESDADQKLSRALLEQEIADVTVLSPHTIDSDNATAGSPAALFLSAFSPNTSNLSSPASVAPLPDDEGQSVAGFTLGPVIAHGGFSIIRRASSPLGSIVAVKIVRRSDLSRQSHPNIVRKRLDHEAAIWASLSHEHILPLFSTVRTTYADFYIMPFCPAGTLFDILKRDFGGRGMPQDDAGMMFRQIVRGVRYLHCVAGLVHGDIKLENVLVDEMGVCRIADFGMARRTGELCDREGCGAGNDGDAAIAVMPMSDHGRLAGNGSRVGGLTLHHSLNHHLGGARYRTSLPMPATTNVKPAKPRLQHHLQPCSLPYASPELLVPQSSTTAACAANPAQDIWALGVLLYTLLTGRLPFWDPFEPRLQMKIIRGTYEAPSEIIGLGAERVLRGCLDASVATRWTIEMVDEVGWGVGWGSAGDDASPTLQPSELPQRSTDSKSNRASRSRSRSRSSHPPSARSRVQVTNGTDSAVRRKRSDSATRPQLLFERSTSLPSASLSLPETITVSTSTHFSADSSFDSSSALLISPELHSVDLDGERGRPSSRRRLTFDHSHSPSPSVAPITPIDERTAGLDFPSIPVSSPSPSMSIVDPDSSNRKGTDRDSSLSRGRRVFRHSNTSSSSNGIGSPDVRVLEVLDETSRWAPSSSSSSHPAISSARTARSSPSSRLDRVARDLGQIAERDRAAKERGKRAGSVPSVSSSSTSLPGTASSPWYGNLWGAMSYPIDIDERTKARTPVRASVNVSRGPRSKSVGFAPDDSR